MKKPALAHEKARLAHEEARHGPRPTKARKRRIGRGSSGQRSVAALRAVPRRGMRRVMRVKACGRPPMLCWVLNGLVLRRVLQGVLDRYCLCTLGVGTPQYCLCRRPRFLSAMRGSWTAATPRMGTAVPGSSANGCQPLLWVPAVPREYPWSAAGDPSSTPRVPLAYPWSTPGVPRMATGPDPQSCPDLVCKMPRCSS